MISEIRIQNFKSIHDLVLKPGRVTVLIGENGSGKSNILEAIAFAAGAAANKLDNEFLFNRGIRVTDDAWMTCAFPDERAKLAQALTEAVASYRLSAPKWKELGEQAATLGLADFMIYAPENTVLRTPPPESAIHPLGTKGEGLLKLLQSFTDPQFRERLADMKMRLRFFGWFEDFLAPDDVATAAARLQIRDKWLDQDRAVFDQRSANEGFLYLLFYFTLLMSWRTPRFFALDNVDNALNPKLCSALMSEIAELAKKYDKQVICTTHNAAILDGMNLHDDDQRLFAVRRDSDGRTVVHRVMPPRPQPGEAPVRLSEAFTRGILGGLPDHF